MSRLPGPHEAFLGVAIARLSADPRLVGVAAGGSYLTGAMDEFSDLDLVVAVEPAAYPSVLADRLRIAGGLGPLLAGFTGEHVGEPRVLICLYGPPLLHVDLKFVSLADVADRVEDPAVLWEREGRLRAALRPGTARFPLPDMQWIEDRFWVWVHYGAAKIGRGELFEAIGFLGFLRERVLGPLTLQARGERPTGVRRLESAAPEAALRMQATLGAYSARSCAAALRAMADAYRSLRAAQAPAGLVLRAEAEKAALAYLQDLAASLPPEQGRPDFLPIGIVRNGVREAKDDGWASVQSEIRLRPELAGGLRGLEEFSHAVVVFLMHEAAFDRDAHLQRRPRDRADMPEAGIFAQRAKHRPNPVGVTTVAIERVFGDTLVVRGLDAVDGTPVLDVKPHFPAFDAPGDPRVPAWVDRLMAGYF
jgi:tRNA-Thr(GGU) m(6)t(6)A37 methyltransferase TsaA